MIITEVSLSEVDDIIGNQLLVGIHHFLDLTI